MAAVAVTIVAVCVVMYTVFEMIERRKRQRFQEDLRRYILKHKGDGGDADEDLR